jgi:hypothetical protein
MRAWIPALVSLWVLPIGYALTLSWLANTETNLALYKAYWGPGSGTYTGVLALALATNASLNLSSTGRYFLAVTAVNVLGLESDFSNEVSWGNGTTNAPPVTNAAPLVVALEWRTNGSPIVSWATRGLETLQGSTNLSGWTDIGRGFYVTNQGRIEVRIATGARQRFFRVREN